MQGLALVTVLLLLVLLLVELGRRSSVPYPTWMVLAGLGIALLPGMPRLDLEPDFVFLVFLPPILYSGAWRTSWSEFRRNLAPITYLAIGLVLATTVAVAAIAVALVPGMSWPVAFVLGAIVSPSDTAAALAVCQRLRVPRRIVTILEGEGLVNDATGLIVMRIALVAVATGGFSLASAASSFLLAGAGGVVLGYLAGSGIARVHARIRDPQISTALSLVAPYAVYLVAMQAQVSAVIAVVAAGLVVSRRSTQVFDPATRLTAIPVWNTLVMLLDGLGFVLLGLQVPHHCADCTNLSWPQLLGLCAVVSLAVVLVRLATVFPLNAILRLLPVRWRGAPLADWRAVTMIGWTGMRGIVSLAGALAVPVLTDDGGAFPQRDLLIVLVFAVILTTIVVQSLSLPWLIRRLGLETGDEEWAQERDARAAMTSAASARLAALRGATHHPAALLEHLAEALAARQALEAAVDCNECVQRGDARLAAEREVERELLAAERQALHEARLRGVVSEPVFRRLERRLDLAAERLAALD